MLLHVRTTEKSPAILLMWGGIGLLLLFAVGLRASSWIADRHPVVGQETALREALPGVNTILVIERPAGRSNRLHKKGQIEISGMLPGAIVNRERLRELGHLVRELRLTTRFDQPPPNHLPDYALNILRCFGQDTETPDPAPVQYEYDSASGKLGRENLAGEVKEWCEVTPDFQKTFRRFVKLSKEAQLERRRMAPPNFFPFGMPPPDGPRMGGPTH